MKKFVKPFVVLFVAALVLLLTSCDILDKAGGTIVVKNQRTETVAGVTTQVPAGVAIVKGVAVNDPEMTIIPAGETKSFDFDENGLYTIVTTAGLPSPPTVTLLGGNTETVTIK